MMDAGLIEYVSIAISIKVSRMIWAYDGHYLAYWQAFPHKSVPHSFSVRSQSKPEVRPRRNRVSYLSYRPEAAPCVPMYKCRLDFSDDTASILNLNQHVFV